MIYFATGHRPDKLGGYGVHAVQRLDLFAIAQLTRLRPEMVIIGMAQGWDQAAGVACIKLGIPFDAYIPFRGQELMWPRHAQQRYKIILDHAANVRLCNPGGYRAEKMQIRNMMMVDAGEKGLAL